MPSVNAAPAQVCYWHTCTFRPAARKMSVDEGTLTVTAALRSNLMQSQLRNDILRATSGIALGVLKSLAARLGGRSQLCAATRLESRCPSTAMLFPSSQATYS